MGRGRKMRRGRIDGQGLGGRGRIIGRCSAKGRSTVGGEGPEGQVAHGPEREIGETPPHMGLSLSRGPLPMTLG